MPDKKPPGSPWEPVWFIGAIIFVIALVWYFNGGPSRSDVRGIFINPPSPVCNGQSYGPTLGNGPTLQQNYYEPATSTNY